MWRSLAVLSLMLAVSVCVWTQPNGDAPYVTAGIFIASIEEGGRIFTPVRLLPFGHPEALTHQFPTVQQFHAGEDRILLILGDAVGLKLSATLERYPTLPDQQWPYSGFSVPPVALMRSAPVIRKKRSDTPLPGLRAVAYLDRFPVSFIVDTRGLTLAQRKMQHATTMGLDTDRAAFIDALDKGAEFAPAKGAAIVTFDQP